MKKFKIILLKIIYKIIQFHIKNLFKLVIDFQIRVRENYLKNFNDIFKQVDLDRNGILSDNEFVKLIEMLNILSKSRRI